MKKSILLLFLLSLFLCIGCHLSSDAGKDNKTKNNSENETGVISTSLETGVVDTSLFNDCKFSK